jgi:hypothetical protein
MAETLLKDRTIIDPDVSAGVLAQLRDSYRNIYTWLQNTFKMDGYHLDSLLDKGSDDLVEMLLGLRLYQALRDLRGSEWFRSQGLWQWFQHQSHVEEGWGEQPKKPIGVRFVMHTEMVMLSHSDFGTQLRISALFGALALNWTIGPDTLVEALLAVIEHPEIGEHGWEKISAGFGFALKDREPEKFDCVYQELRSRLGEAW